MPERFCFPRSFFRREKRNSKRKKTCFRSSFVACNFLATPSLLTARASRGWYAYDVVMTTPLLFALLGAQRRRSGEKKAKGDEEALIDRPIDCCSFSLFSGLSRGALLASLVAFCPLDWKLLSVF